MDCWVHVTPLDSSTPLSKLVPKVFKACSFIYWEMTKAWERSDFSKCEVMLGVWDTLKKKKRKKQRPFGLEWRAKTESPFLGYCVWVPEWVSEQETQKEKASAILRCSPCGEIERNTVKVWEGKNRKMRHFFFSQVTHNKDKFVEFS